MNHSKGRGKWNNNRRRLEDDKTKHGLGCKAQDVLNTVADSSPIIQAFKQYSIELDTKHDKYERIVKLSRDITIESKRIIFLLHSIDRETVKDTALEDAESRFIHLTNIHFKAIANELKGEDPFHFLNAYTAGLQEYVEARTFYYFMKHNDLPLWNSIQNNLRFICNEEVTNSDVDVVHINEQEPTTLETLAPMTDYILGIADLTGELMRKCINGVGTGNIEGCFQTCAVVRDIYKGFLRIGNLGPRKFTKKLCTLKQSLNKMEMACYTIHVRGSEIPKHMLADVFSNTDKDIIEEDEGFF